MGFMLFRNFKTEEDNRFTDPVKSFLSVLHAYASRSFSMLLLDFMYAESQWTPLFFASLTVVADLLCSSLLISLGTRGYNSFATELYERRLRKRRNAALEIHRLLAVNGYMNLDSWLRLCKYMPQYDILQKYAAEIFLFECAESSSAMDMLDCRHFFRLLALASTDVFLFKQNQSQVSILGQPSDNAVGDRVVVNPLGAGGDQPTNGPSLGAEESSSKHQIPESSFAFRHDRYQKWCVMLLSHSVRIGESIEISPFKAFSKINQLLLFIFLIMYTSPNKTRDAWVISIWILEFLFVGEMLIKIIAFGRKAYLSTAINRGEFLINFATFIMLCFNNHDDNSAARVLLILASLCRYLWLFKVIPRFELFESLVPLFLHVGLLIFAIIYFFSAFAYVRFCDSMSVENATDTDDDSATWVRYEDILNFHTFGQSFHTLFQVSILGTWAMVLTTAAKEHPWAANLFFYPFRFIMVLTVYPLLFSFIIQAFALRDEKKIKDASEVEDKPSDTSPADATAEGNVVFGDIPMKVVEKNFLPLRPEEKSLLREEIKYFLCDIASNGYTPKCDYVKFADGAEVYSENTYLNYDSIFAQKIYPDRVSRSRRSDSRSAPSSHVSSLASSMIETNVLHISKMTNSDIDNTGMQLWIRPLSEKNADLQNALRREEILKNKLDMALFYLKMCSSASSKGPDDTDINEIQISQDT